MPHTYHLRVSCWKLPLVLAAIAGVLLLCHTSLMVYHYRVDHLHWLLLQLFDVDQEHNLPSWYSEFLLLTTTGFLYLYTRRHSAERRPHGFPWYMLTIGFGFLAVDELAGIHETINTLIEITWAIPAAFGVGILGLSFVPFLLRLPTRTALLFVLGGVLYVGGAVGVEILGDALSDQGLEDTLQYKMSTLQEEGMEMFGPIVFLYALLCHMREPGTSTVQASVEVL